MKEDQEVAGVASLRAAALPGSAPSQSSLSRPSRAAAANAGAGVVDLEARSADQGLELVSLRHSLARADHSRTVYARALEKMRRALVAVHDGLEDEGDRIYLGSTNHAENLQEAWHLADALNWDEVLAHTQPKTTLAEVNLRLQDELGEARAALAEAARTNADLCEALDEMIELARPNVYPQPDKPDSPYAKLERALAAIRKSRGEQP